MKTAVPANGPAPRCSGAFSALTRWAAAVLLAMAGIMSTSSVGKAADGEPCPDVEVIFARGTLEPPGLGATGQAFADALTERLPGRSIDAYGVDYPASLNFSQAAEGVVDASNKIEETVASCPTTKMVVGGYSQGAAVAAYITADSVPPGYPLPPGITGPMPPNTARHVAAVVLFGKPSNGVVQLVDRNAPPITIGNLYAGKTIDLCASDDPVCASSGFSRAAHSSYRFNGMTDQAAEFAVANINDGR